MIFQKRVDNFNVLVRLAGNIENKKILDFGGNRGNTLYFSNGRILEENYTSIDVDPGSIEQGSREFPKAEWIHWNRYHPRYNPAGFANPFPIQNKCFDIIWSHSVFTHLNIEDTLYCLEQLLKLNGDIIFSFVRTENNRKLLKLASIGEIVIDDTTTELINNAKYAVILDKSTLVLNTVDLSEIKYSKIWVFYSVEFLLDLIGNLVKQYHRSVKYTTAKGWDWIIIK